MIPMQSILIDLTPSLAPVMLWVNHVLVGTTAVLTWQALRAIPRVHRHPIARPVPLAA
jgi:hypothetical protein